MCSAQKDSLCALTWVGHIKVGEVGHLMDETHMAALGLGCRKVLVGNGLANSRLGCTNRLRKPLLPCRFFLLLF